MLLRRVLKLSVTLRNPVLLLPQSVSSYLHIQQFCGTTDYVNSSIKKTNASKFLTGLQKVKKPSKVLDILETNIDALKSWQIVGAIRYILPLITRDTNSVSGKQQLFIKLNEVIESNINKFSTQDLIRLLEIFHEQKKHKEKHSHLFENNDFILSHLYCNLHSINLEDYNRLSLLIKKSELTPAARSLLNALSRRILSRLSIGINDNDYEFIEAAFFNAVENETEDKLLILKKCINGIIESKEKLSTTKAAFMLEAIVLLKDDFEEKHEFYNFLKSHIMAKIMEINTHDSTYIFRSLRKAMRIGKTEFYDSSFIDSLVQEVITTDAGFVKGLEALQFLNEIRHVHFGLLNYMSAKCYENIELCENPINNKKSDLLVILTGLALANHKPVFWKELETLLTDEKILKLDKETLLFVAFHLSILDCYDHKILKIIFDKRCSYTDGFQLKTFCKLYQNIAMKKDYVGPLPTQAQIESLRRLHKVRNNFPLLNSLVQLIGSEEYIKNDVWTNSYHRMDHLIVFEENGNPVAINRNVDIASPMEFINQLNLPKNCIKVAILRTNNHWYCRNNEKLLLGTDIQNIQHLEKQNISVVVIRQSIWSELCEEEQNSFLQDAIQNSVANFAKENTEARE